MISFDFTDLHLDIDRPKDAIETLLHVVATFSVNIDGDEYLREEEFPVVELATQFEYWLKHGADSEFAYQSLEYEDVLLSFKPDAGGWRLFSDWRERPSDRVLTLAELRAAAQSYVDRVKRDAKKRLNIDVAPAFHLRR